MSKMVNSLKKVPNTPRNFMHEGRLRNLLVHMRESDPSAITPENMFVMADIPVDFTRLALPEIHASGATQPISIAALTRLINGVQIGRIRSTDGSFVVAAFPRWYDSGAGAISVAICVEGATNSALDINIIHGRRILHVACGHKRAWIITDLGAWLVGWDVDSQGSVHIQEGAVPLGDGGPLYNTRIQMIYNADVDEDNNLTYTAVCYNGGEPTAAYEVCVSPMTGQHDAPSDMSVSELMDTLKTN